MAIDRRRAFAAARRGTGALLVNALGAALAPVFSTNRMLWTMAAFLLALGISAHALDELHGGPAGQRGDVADEGGGEGEAAEAVGLPGARLRLRGWGGDGGEEPVPGSPP